MNVKREFDLLYQYLKFSKTLRRVLGRCAGFSNDSLLNKNEYLSFLLLYYNGQYLNKKNNRTQYPKVKQSLVKQN